MTVEAVGYSPRAGSRAALAIWVAWMATAIALCAGPFGFHLDYVRVRYPGLEWTFVGALAAAAALAPPLYHRLLRRRLWRWEPALLAGAALAALAAYEPAATAAVLWMSAAAYGAGRFIRRRLGLDVEPAAAEISVSCAFGFGLLIVVLAVLGLARLWHGWVFAAALAVLTAAGARELAALPSRIGALYRSWAGDRQLGERFPAAAVVLVAILCGATVVVMLAPSIAYDPLAFHLALVRNYLAHHGLVPMTADFYGYFPQGVEVLMTLAWSLAGQAGAQMVQPVFFALFGLALVGIGRTCGFSRSATLAGAAMAAAIPFVHWTGSMPKNDLAVAFYHLTGLLAFLLWQRTGSFRLIQAGTLVAALSLHFKHPAAFGVLGLAALYVYAAWRQPRRLRAFTSCAAIFLVAGTFWAARTWIEKGDPFFPSSVAEPINTDPAEDFWSPSSRAVRVLTIPWEMHFHGDLWFQSLTPNPLGVFLVFTLPAWFLLRRRARSAPLAACYVFCAVFLLPWGAQLPVLRFAIAPLSLLILIAGARLADWHAQAAGAVRAVLEAAWAFAAVFSLCVIVILELTAPQFLYLAGGLDRDAYLRRSLLTYESLRALDGRAGPDEYVFAVKNCSRAYAPFPDRFVCTYAESDGEELESILRALAATDYRYLILPAGSEYGPVLEFARSRSAVETLYAGPHFAVYRLAPGKR